MSQRESLSGLRSRLAYRWHTSRVGMAWGNRCWRCIVNRYHG